MQKYGRALLKGIGVLRVQWPDSTPPIHRATASQGEIVAGELFADGSLDGIAMKTPLGVRQKTWTS
jgi:hypothetical protein